MSEDAPRLEPADIAYSRGVLHHTGSIWEAVESAAWLMRGDITFFGGPERAERPVA
jgi:hypothetical protein